jgi:coenzyme F420-0:L-glutamate ligase / coenzyme F420-1:gamma-L-glutamate ligase
VPESGPAPVPESLPESVLAVALAGIGEVRAGDDLARIVLAATSGPEPGPAPGPGLVAGDVLVISSKIVSKALGLVHTGARDDVIAAGTRRVVARRRTPRGTSAIVEAVAGPVLAAAGVDASNTEPGTVLSLPGDPDAAARHLRAGLRAAGAPLVGVVISDTSGRPWRRGQTDFALGVAGVVPVEDLRGTPDASGQLLEVTERAVADELAAAADLVKGKAGGTPVALVRGLGRFVTQEDGPGAAALLRAAAGDWFRLGHVEAVRACLGVGPGSQWASGSAEIEPPSVLPEPVSRRLARAILVATATLPDRVRLIDRSSPRAQDSQDSQGEDGREVAVDGDPFWCGVACQRLLAALWAEDLPATMSATPDGRSARVRLTS